ncbi:hypothetical protein AYM17_03820 [Coxiella burnetii]|uniref:hypothetical protein n=1 Tax=Coxiella burnetii TaxID=777 RepID=UPI000C04BDC0|nr:hypothetical protein [Coxiella burnetii]ATN66584.1 hypothetical protein AYM17_03820 [Coxiella burnetii]
MPKTRKASSLVTVLKGTDIIYDSKTHSPDAEVEAITKNALRQRRQRVTVLAGTDEIFDPEKHSPDAKVETITKGALWNRQCVSVLAGTDEIYDPETHPPDAKIESITRNALQQRQHITVLAGTSEVYDPEKHPPGAKVETITKRALWNRRQRVMVLAGTDEIFDPEKHSPDAKVEIITKNAMWQRQRVRVLEGTDEIYDPEKHSPGAKVESITRNALWNRRQRITVLEGTDEIFDPEKHSSDAKVEAITKNTLRRRQRVRVLEGTDEIYDPEKHFPDAKVETITKNALWQRQRITVLEGTDEIFDLEKHSSDTKVEIITKSTLRNRRQRVTVLEGTDEIYNYKKHLPGAKVETITKSALWQRNDKKTKKRIASQISPGVTFFNAPCKESNPSVIKEMQFHSHHPIPEEEKLSPSQPHQGPYSAFVSSLSSSKSLLASSLYSSSSSSLGQLSRFEETKEEARTHTASSTSTRFFKKSKVKSENDAPIHHPISEENIRKAVDILRRNCKARFNCAHLATSLMVYFESGQMPSAPALTTPSNSYKIAPSEVEVENIVKKEKGVAGHSVKKQRITACTFIHTQKGPHSRLPVVFEHPVNSKGIVDIEKGLIGDLTQEDIKGTSVYVDNLNATLQVEAKNNGGGAYGTIDLFSNDVDNTSSHEIAFYATDERVIYIDAQNVNGGQGDPIFYNMREEYSFDNLEDKDEEAFNPSSLCFYLCYGYGKIANQDHSESTLQSSM